MKIKNNRKNVLVLRFSDGGKVKIQKIKAGQLIEIPSLKNERQIVNKFLLRNKFLSIVTDPIVAEEAVLEVKVITKSKIEKAIEKADEFIAGDVNKDGVVDGKDLSIVHKAYSKAKTKKTKTKK